MRPPFQEEKQLRDTLAEMVRRGLSMPESSLNKIGLQNLPKSTDIFKVEVEATKKLLLNTKNGEAYALIFKATGDDNFGTIEIHTKNKSIYSAFDLGSVYEFHAIL